MVQCHDFVQEGSVKLRTVQVPTLKVFRKKNAQYVNQVF